MCGRFTLMTDEEYQDIADILRQIEQQQGEPIPRCDIYPTMFSPILFSENGPPQVRLLRWGYPGFQGKKPLINARAETAEIKPLFRESLKNGRCVVPSCGFYEWGREKQRYRFRIRETTGTYMAGLTRIYNGEKRYVILTTAANESVQAIHHRMPVILRREEIHDWLTDPEQTLAFLLRVPPLLECCAV